MIEKSLQYNQIREALLLAIPEIRDGIREKFGTYYNLDLEMPDAYPIFEDVLKPLLLKSLEDQREETYTARIFDFLEAMANSPDPNVSRDLLCIAVLEPLVFNRKAIREAWQHMGPRTRELARAEAATQGHGDYIPIDS
ncbi:MAG TPA: hypothetical protein VMI32_04825 [Candidatus Solibacter sp.]|nr:hypothetical protein [Candidatus Solibacter sp.]